VEAVRAQMPYAAALQAHNAVGRLNVATYINRLIKIQSAVVAPA
jgi:ribosomal protein S30